MRLKKLELVGFKSFVDPTSIDFSPGISGIVGPNGCGKSNIVDALRWVLGEQSAMRLRGDAMEDVIFNGNQHRPATGMAEVSLLLDNDDPASVENPSDIFQSIRDQAEILVTRRYFRSGESEYLINRRPCRLKDITELFLGTGVGTKAYAIVEQGRVNQLVEAKAEDLRLFIEEAAGTTLYRSRRLAAERKMERTEENLRSVSSLLAEIDKQIAFLRRMAKKAEQYRLLAEELRGVELELGRLTHERLSLEMAELAARRDELKATEASLEASITTVEARREESRRRLAIADEDFRQHQESYYALRTARERAEARLEMLDREEYETNERLARIARDRRALEGQRDALGTEADAGRVALAEEESQRAAGDRALASEVAAAADEEAAVTRLESELEQAKTEIVECLRLEAELRNARATAERDAAEREERRARLANELSSLEGDSMAESAGAERIADERLALAARVETLRRDLEAAVAEARTLAALRTELDGESVAIAGALAEAESRLAAAEEVERDFGRYQEGVQAVMRRHSMSPNGVVNLVGRVLEAPAEYEKAVAAVLGERLQYVVVRAPEDARDAVTELKQAAAGRSSFIPLKPRHHPPPALTRDVPEGGASAPRPSPDAAEGVVTALLDVVRVDEGFDDVARCLLEDAVVVRDLDAGLELWRRNGRERTIVTPDGEVIHPNGVVSGGSAAPAEERLLSQRREIRRLREEVERLQAESTRVEARRRETAAALEIAEARRVEITEALASLGLEEVRLAKDGERVGDRLSRNRAEIARRQDELERVAGELVTLAGERERAAADLGAAASRRTAEEEHRAAISTSLADARSRHEARATAVTELRVAAAAAREKEEALRERLQRLEREAVDLARRMEDLLSEGEALAMRARERAEERSAQHELAERTRGEESVHGAEFERRRAALEAIRNALDEDERRLAADRNELERARRERSEREIAVAERQMHLDGGAVRIRELYQVELAELALDNSSPEAGASGDEETLRVRAQELRQKVDRMDRSSIGIEAAGELAELEMRRDSLATQKEDLERAIEDLKRTIASLNRESRDRFAATFAAVDAKFQETFPKLFGGGRARLQLTDETNLLETGVDIHCQPPGMNLRTLSLLSGGQKALTAVSLIFALFLCKPSPFCVLDEVDAPLDDANIDRFNKMVHEMGQGSQFLLITHNKRTMEVADTLYGVTMQEPGVSKVVSVRFDRAA